MTVEKYRKFSGFTQQDMADKLQISKQSYWNKENGRTAFSDEEKVKIKNMFTSDFPDITYEELFFNEMVLKSN